MMLWELLVNRAKSDSADREKNEARKLLQQLPVVNQRLNWKDWQRKYAALMWLVEHCHNRLIIGAMPTEIDSTITKIFAETRVGIVGIRSQSAKVPTQSIRESELKIKLTQSNKKLSRYYKTKQFEDLTAFWQAVFVGFFSPRELEYVLTVCSWCGKRLPELSRVKLCNACKQKKYRAENREVVLERDAKRRRQERKK